MGGRLTAGAVPVTHPALFSSRSAMALPGSVRQRISACERERGHHGEGEGVVGQRVERGLRSEIGQRAERSRRVEIGQQAERSRRVAIGQRVSGRARIDRVILEVASRQHGVVTRSQLIDAGVSQHRIAYRIECGMLTRVYRGVFAAGPVRGPLAREFAAVLAAGAESFVSHRAAGAVLELLPPRRAEAPVAISTRRDVRIGSPGIRIVRVSRLETDEVMVRNGLPLTTPARTILDLAGVCSSRHLEQALATALRNRLVERTEVEALLDRYPRRAGRGRLRALLTADGGPAFTRSEAERRLLDLIRTAGLPRPSTNVIVEGFEVDLLWPEQRLIVEVDGREYHGGDHAFEGDRTRDGVLMAAGFRTMRVTWRQIANEPQALMARVAQTLVR